ncbi:MAG TPA: dockerin type I domain-containing protein [Pseudobacteroides sp.]|uniref:dockerin type I domain-containing protein n=1 Tax=Pseudobacteroides sp. TaxID=1968840 RepID=UPI002F9504A6
MGKYYGKTIEYSGPIIKSATKEGSKVRISFDHIGSGLAAGTKVGTEPVQLSTGSAVKGFAIAGADGKFVWADATIDAGTVLVSAASVANPGEVRYSWASNPIGNLYNKEGLPASPFRTNVSTTAQTPTPTNKPSATPAGYSITGYIAPDFVNIQSAAPQQLSGFRVEVSGTTLSALTNEKGVFELKDAPASSSGYKLMISKNGFLKREIDSVKLTDNVIISTQSSPITMWAGDIAINGVKDDAINMMDIIQIARVFNSVSNDGKYDVNCDLNSDGAINMSDVVIVARHFNKVSADYPVM